MDIVDGCVMLTSGNVANARDKRLRQPNCRCPLLSERRLFAGIQERLHNSNAAVAYRKTIVLQHRVAVPASAWLLLFVAQQQSENKREHVHNFLQPRQVAWLQRQQQQPLLLLSRKQRTRTLS